MNDLSAFPFPDNAPAPGECVRIERPEPGLAVVVLDPPHRSLAVIDGPLVRDFERAVTELEADKSLQGVVITGRNTKQFLAGADISVINELTDPEALGAVVRAVHAIFARLEALDARTVAAIGGAAPGGALEMSLACDFIVATDDKGTRIGLPETMLGIIPGWGGCHRLPRRIGVPAALNAILTGRLYAARQAKKIGIVDRLVKPENLLRIASDVAMGRERLRRPSRGWKSWAVDRNPLAQLLIARGARKQVMAKTRGHYPAPLKALELVTEAPTTSMADAADKEADATAKLASGPICKNLISIFLASEEAKKLGKLPDGSKAKAIERAGVIGAGVMGGAMASLLAEKGVQTRLADLSPKALDAAVLQHRADVGKKLRRRRLQKHEANAAIDRLDPSRAIEGFGRTQIVVEAVAEKLAVKQSVFGAIAEQAGPECILATNTSSLSVDAIAEGLPHPERVCGMHFFNPVKRMPLVEVIKGTHTSDEVVATVSALALQLGKTPVVVADVAGFLVNRLLGPYLDEALRLFVAGADPEHVDRLMLSFGMPMGPFALLDEVGLDIAAHAAASLEAAYGERMIPCAGIEQLMNPERLGKKTGQGFYRHVAPTKKGKKTKPVICDDLSRYQTDSTAKSFRDSQIVDRLVLSMVNEAARCLEENVVDGPVALDLATVFGTGFAPFRGGLLRHADSLGLGIVVEKLDEIAEAADVSHRPGGKAKFTPASLLRQLASEGGSFHQSLRTPRRSSKPVPTG